VRVLRWIGLAVVAVVGVSLLWGLGAYWATRAPAPLPAPSRGFTLERVTLVEPGGTRTEAARLVVDERGRIAGIEPSSADGIVPFADAFVLPGLTDMHVHLPASGLPGEAEYTLLMLLSHGVTTARMLGGSDVPETNAMRERIDAGTLAGPRLFTCVVWLDGPAPVIPGARVVDGADAARAVADELADAGADCLKPYDRLDRETITALREAADRRGLPLVGHNPQDVPLEIARLDDAQHMRGVHPPFEPDDGRTYPHFLRPWLRMDDARFTHVVRVAREHEIAFTPTLVAIEGTLRARDWETWRAGPEMRSWLPQLRDGVWSGEVGFNPVRFMSDDDFTMLGSALEEMKRTVAKLHAAGVPLHTGTDCNAPNTVPGASLHRELRLWAEAGIDAEDVLHASMVASPRFVGIEAAGSLAPGAPADMAIFRRDPTNNIEALESLVAVARDGRLYTRASLDERLQRYRDHYESTSFDVFVMTPIRAVLRATTAVLRSRRIQGD
jgi:hypothetical protein